MALTTSAPLPTPAIGPVRLENPFVLSPMAGIGDPPYRRLCRRGGAALVCAEMVSANALHYRDERSQRMLQTFPDEHPVSLQIFGNDPDRLADAARAAAAAGADVVDLNCGCPVPKITKSGGGVSLMRDESLFARCLAAMVKAVRVPVTVKMRLGFARGDNDAPRFARIAEDVGVAAVAVHARSREARHAGAPDLDALAAVTRAVRVPVFGNGGVRSFDDARRMLDAGCAGVLVGQAAVGNPFFFRELLAAAAGRAAPMSLKERFDLLREHARLIVEYYGESLGLRRLRKYLPAYVHGLPHAAAFRGAANRLERHDEFLSFLAEFESRGGSVFPAPAGAGGAEDPPGGLPPL